MPRARTLLLTATLAAVCFGARVPARGQEQQPPPARDQVDELERSRLAAERDAQRAEELYQEGKSLVESGRADAATAVRTFGEALKLYVSLYTERTLPGPDSGAAYRAMMRGRMRHAPECVERYLRFADGQTAFERSQLEALRGHALGLRAEDGPRAVFNGSEVDTRARITHKPEPGFSEEARQKNARGVVRLRAVLGSDGTVRHVFVVKGMPYDITEGCVAAAEKIKFKPAVKGGRPVSQFVVLEYNFNTY
ncbi:MAG TPA: energy transducer TonB [Pyrinomonadaceae bacterium]|nr:energy transducer TonB [Pyrinomonadaceae bacterium]